MKKVLVASILGIAATAATVGNTQAQGTITFNTYAAGGVYITYGATTATPGLNVGSGFTAAIYWAQGTPSIGSDPNPLNTSDPSTLTGGLQLYTGPNATVTMASDASIGLINGGALTFGFGAGPITFEVVAYNGTTYANSSIRAHSAPFVENLVVPPSPVGNLTTFTGFSVQQVPEPSTIALAGLGLASLLVVRRRK